MGPVTKKGQEMKTLFLAMTFLAGALAQAQSPLRAHTTTSQSTRDVRVQMEKQTESLIVEMLEEQRLADEKRRRDHFEQLNFSVVGQPQQAVAAAPVVYAAPAQQAPVVVVPAAAPVASEELPTQYVR
jgi:hypothetical protein